jgi:TetR/AcrR family transcriptional regulator, cholesterol catabolism regulator
VVDVSKGASLSETEVEDELHLENLIRNSPSDSRETDRGANQLSESRAPITLDLLLKVSARHFRAKGFAGTTTRDLADSLSIQRASLYYHVKSKEEILWQICIRSLNRVIDATESALVNAPVGERIRTLIVAHLEATLSDLNMHVVMLIEMKALSLHHAAELLSRRKAYLHLIQGQIASEQDAGHIRADMDPKVLALALLNLANWTVFWFDSEGAWSAEDLSENLAEIFLNGCRQIGTV